MPVSPNPSPLSAWLRDHAVPLTHLDPNLEHEDMAMMADFVVT